MGFNLFKPKPAPPIVRNRESNKNEDNCKIKIKNSGKGQTIEFSGNCRKEEIAVAREQFLEGNRKRYGMEDNLDD